MSIIRLYTGPDGQTHIEALDLASHQELAVPHATTNIVFRTSEPGRFSDWHNAPRRQYVINLAGDEAVVQAVACEAVSRTQLPLSRLSLAELPTQARVALGKPMSRNTIRRMLDPAALKPWRYE